MLVNDNYDAYYTLRSLSILILDMEISPIMQCMYLLGLNCPDITPSLPSMCQQQYPTRWITMCSSQTV